MRFRSFWPPPFSHSCNLQGRERRENRKMFASSSQCREMKDTEEEDDRIRTIVSLRGRLLAERVASKAAKIEAQNLDERLELLEKKLAEEIRCKNRAEKRLKYALKRLESLRLREDGKKLEFSESCESSSSQNCFLGFQGSEELKSDLQKEEDSGQSRSPGPGSADGMPVSDYLSADLQESSDDSSRLPCEEASMHVAVKGNGSLALALVPVSKQMNADGRRLQGEDEVQGVLLALRNVKEQLLHSMQRRTGVY